MDIPDIVGMTLGEARTLLGKAGIGISSVQVTAPPRNRSEVYEDFYRVIKSERTGEDTLELLVCKPL